MARSRMTVVMGRLLTAVASAGAAGVSAAPPSAWSDFPNVLGFIQSPCGVDGRRPAACLTAGPGTATPSLRTEPAAASPDRISRNQDGLSRSIARFAPVDADGAPLPFPQSAAVIRTVYPGCCCGCRMKRIVRR